MVPPAPPVEIDGWERNTRPSSAPPQTAPSRATPSSSLVLDVDARQPPTINPQILAALNALELAHMRVGSPLTTITSWFRDPTRNLAAGGAPNSLHLVGLAFDLRADAAGQAVAAAWSAGGLQVVDERASSKPHWHLEFQRA